MAAPVQPVDPSVDPEGVSRGYWLRSLLARTNVCLRIMTFTENVSTRGVRVTTVRRWEPGTRVLVTFLRNGVRFEGRVAYCQRGESGDFAVGVELSEQLQSRMGRLT
jgi:hypothetical protein